MEKRQPDGAAAAAGSKRSAVQLAGTPAQIERLTEALRDAEREFGRLCRLLARQETKRRRQTKTIRGTRARLARADQRVAECSRALDAAKAPRGDA